MKNRLLWIALALILVAAGAIWFFTKRPTDVLVNDELKCESNTAQNGIHIVAERSLIIAGDAEIVSSGSLQFAESENLLADSDAEFEALYQDAASDTGAGQRVGPLADEESVAM